MIKRLLLLASTVCTLIVVLSFALFAKDEASAGSSAQQTKLAVVDTLNPSAAGQRARAAEHTQVREWIDKANDKLVSPFTGVAKSSNNIWIQRGMPALLAVLGYFVVLRLLAGYAIGLSRPRKLSPS